MLQLKKFPDIPVFTREEARESRPHPEEPRFRLLAREVGSFPCVVESVPEPEDFCPVLTWIFGYFWSLPKGVSPRLEWGHARALYS